MTEAKNGETVWVRARLAISRAQGKNLVFLVLRQGTASIQSVAAKSEAITKDFLTFVTE